MVKLEFVTHWHWSGSLAPVRDRNESLVEEGFGANDIFACHLTSADKDQNGDITPLHGSASVAVIRAWRTPG